MLCEKKFHISKKNGVILQKTQKTVLYLFYMKLEVGIITTDELWVQRIIDKLSLDDFLFFRYADKDNALSNIAKDKIKVLLVDDDIRFTDDELNEHKICRNALQISADNNANVSYHTALAFLEHNDNIEEDYNSPTVLKYAPLKVFTEQVEALYTVIANDRYKFKRNSSSTYILNVTSPIGGVGVTTVSIAISEILARRGKRVLYISLDKFANNHYFYGVGQKTLSDIIFALKIQNNDIKLAMQQALRKCEDSGVYYMEPPSNPYDAYEMTNDEILAYINACQVLDFDYLIFDSKGTVDMISEHLVKSADLNIVLANGKAESSEKVNRFYSVISQIDENSTLVDSLLLVYNAFNSSSTRISELDDGSAAGINRYDGYNFSEIIKSIIDDKKLEGIISKI